MHIKSKFLKIQKYLINNYGVTSGYLLSVESEDENKNLNTTNYSDFRSVNGIIFPFKLEIQGQKINITEILINEEIKDSSF